MIVEGKRVDITCIADLHGHYPELEGGDLLIVAGDLTRSDTEQNWFDFLVWITNQASLYKRIIVIAGNHDSNLEKYVGRLWPYNGMISYLCDWGTQFEYVQPINNSFNPDDKSLVYRKTLKIWGSPWTKRFEGMNPNCMAFTLDHDLDYEEDTKHGRMFQKNDSLELKWALIPDDVDILITHSPPYDILDEVESQQHCTSWNFGSRSLLKRVCEIKPKLHVFGHVHEGYGKFKINNWRMVEIKNGGLMKYEKCTTFINASHVNENYEPVNRPIRVIL